MPRQLSVHPLPGRMPKLHPERDLAVIVDVLRASTTITTALENGAKTIVPCLTPEEAVQKKAAWPIDRKLPLLGGERGGLLIDGFDLDNSPLSWGADVVGDREILFTTTNGTKALLEAKAAKHIIIGCMRNRAAVAERLIQSTGDVHIVCAGTDGNVTLEDLVFAGRVSDILLQSGMFTANHDALLSVDLSMPSETDATFLLRAALGGRNLLRHGFDEDIAFCALLDQSKVVPVFDHERNGIVAG